MGLKGGLRRRLIYSAGAHSTLPEAVVQSPYAQCPCPLGHPLVQPRALTASEKGSLASASPTSPSNHFASLQSEKRKEIPPRLSFLLTECVNRNSQDFDDTQL